MSNLKVLAFEVDSSSYVNDLLLSFRYHHGVTFPMHKSTTYFTNENINGIELRAGKTFPEINTRRPPEIGVGYYFSNLGNREVFGYTNSLFLFFNSVLIPKRPLSIEHSISTGISYLNERFDVNENNFNRAIGSHLNIFFIYSVSARVRISDDAFFTFGPAIAHMSNGNITQPNFGINLINTNAGITWRIRQNARARTPLFLTKEPYNKNGYDKNRYIFLFTGGVRQVSRMLERRYFTSSVVAEYSRRFWEYGAAGGGIDFFYDPTEGRETHVTGERVEDLVPWHAGIHLSYEVLWGKLSFILQPGYKIITPSPQAYYSFNRIGMRYYPGEKYIINFSLKSHRFAADYFELGGGLIF